MIEAPAASARKEDVAACASAVAVWSGYPSADVHQFIAAVVLLSSPTALTCTDAQLAAVLTTAIARLDDTTVLTDDRGVDGPVYRVRDAAIEILEAITGHHYGSLLGMNEPLPKDMGPVRRAIVATADDIALTSWLAWRPRIERSPLDVVAHGRKHAAAGDAGSGADPSDDIRFDADTESNLAIARAELAELHKAREIQRESYAMRYIRKCRTSPKLCGAHSRSSPLPPAQQEAARRAIGDSGVVRACLPAGAKVHVTLTCEDQICALAGDVASAPSNVRLQVCLALALETLVAPRGSYELELDVAN